MSVERNFNDSASSSNIQDSRKLRLGSQGAGMAHELTPEQQTTSEALGHGNENGTNKRRIDSRSAAAYPRKRASQACLVCRSRKSRCDNERPVCGFCKLTGTKCTYPGTELSKIDSASLLILDRVARMEARLSNQISELQGASLTTSVMNQIQTPLAPSPASLRSAPASAPRFGLHGINGDTIMSWPIIQRLLNEMSEAAQWSVALDEDSSGLVDSPSIVLEITPSLSSRQTSSAIQELEHTNNITDYGIRSESYQELALIESYFAHVHSKSPIFDPEWFYGFRTQVLGMGWEPTYYAGTSSAKGLCPTRICIYLLVLALGYLTENEGNNPPGRPIESSIYFEYASSWMGPSVWRRSRELHMEKENAGEEGALLESIERVQCLLLTGTYFMWSMRPWDARKVFGEATIIAKTFSHYGRFSNNISDEVVDLRFRVFWATAKAESEMQEEILGLAPGGGSILSFTHLDQFPKPPPLEDHEDFRSDSVATQTWFYYLAEVASRKVLNRISKELYQGMDDRLYATTTETGTADRPLSLSMREFASLYPVVKELEIQIREWSASLPGHIFDESSGNEQEFLTATTSRPSGIGPELRQHLENRKFHARITTFRPFLQTIVLSQTLSQDQTVPEVEQVNRSKDYSTVLEGAFECVVVCIEFLEVQGEPRRHFGSWRRGRAIWAASLSLLAAAMVPDLNSAMRDGMIITDQTSAAALGSPNGPSSWLSRAKKALGSAAAWLYQWKEESPSLLLGARTIWEGLGKAQREGLFN